MKTSPVSLLILLGLSIFIGCKKTSTTPPKNTDPLSPLYGIWQTTDLGGPNDTARISIDSSSTNVFATYVSAATVAATGCGVGIAVFQTISAAGKDTIDMQYPYRFGANLGESSITNGYLILQTSTTMLALPLADPWDNITPAPSHWVKLP
jgi:hypothetical protein